MGDKIPIEIDFPLSDAMGRGATASAEGSAIEGAGIRLGRYTTVRLLGKGGMAEVYLAHQDGPAGFQKTCVVKRMRKVLGEEPRFVEMFLREARVAARLNHNNVVQIFELVQEQGEYFIAMEYLDGVSLHRAARRCWANDTSIPMEVILRSVADAALGLHHAHTQRDASGQISPLVHRDVSPDNLVVTRDGITKVLDFGIAKANSEVDEVTKTGELKGKIPYMSPEQIRGDVLDGRSDLWSLGVSLYWLLTGQRPFDGGTDHMTIDHILRKKPVPPRELNGLIPIGLENVIVSLLQKDPQHRMASGLELRDRLVSLLGPSSGPGAASSFCNRVMEMPAAETKVGPSSVLTIIAARPETRWLKHVSESGEHEDLLSLVPDSQREFVSPSLSTSGSDVDTAETVTNVSGQHAIERDAPSGRFGAIVAGAGLLVVLAVAGLWLLSGDDHARETVPATAPRTAATTPPGNLTAEATSAGDVATIPKGAGGNVMVTSAPSAAADDLPTQPLTKAKPSTDGEDAENTERASRDGNKAADKADKKDNEDKAHKTNKTDKRATSTKRAARAMSVSAKAPSTITWRTTRGKRLGKGSGTLTVPKGTKSVVAVDAKTGGKTTIDVSGGSADYGAVKNGMLMLRIRPWAKASVGRKALGTTPMDAVRLKAGRYRVKLVWNDKTKVVSVDVRPGRQSVLKADMRKD